MPQLKIDLIVKDDGSVVVKEFGSNAEKAMHTANAGATKFVAGLGAVLAAVTALAGALGIYKLNQAINEWVRLANEQERVEVRLVAVLRSTGEAAGFNIDQMKAMASQMQSVTTVGDEVIMSAQAILATFKQIRGEGFERATKAALDMSEVMQQDLKSSIVQVAKALNDPIANLGALGRAGVQFTADQKETIQTLWEMGKTAEAQGLILTELESQFGGAAEAAANTFGGAMQQLKNTMGDVGETLGSFITKNETFIEIIKSVKELMSGLDKILIDNKQYFRELAVDGVLVLADSFIFLMKSVAWLHETWLKIKIWSLEMTELFTPGLGEFFGETESSRLQAELQKTQSFYDNIVDTLERLRLRIDNVIPPLIDAGEAGSKAGKQIAEGMEEATKSVQRLDNQVANLYKELFEFTGYQIYAQKAIESYGKVLDSDERTWAAILGNADDAKILRIKKEEEFVEALFRNFQEIEQAERELAESRIGITRDMVAEKMHIEQQLQRGFNVPYPGTNISTMTGMPIGYSGSIVSGPTVPDGSKWFPSQWEAEWYLQELEWLAKSTKEVSSSQFHLTKSAQTLSSAFNQLESQFRSSYQNFQSFITERERRTWSPENWLAEFANLSNIFQTQTDPELQLKTLNDMLDVLKQLDTIAEQQLQAQRQLGKDYLTASQSIGSFIMSLKFGPQAAGTSYGSIMGQYETFRAAAGTPEGAQDFISFTQSIFLPFMKAFVGGGGYGQTLEAVIKDLETASNVLKGKSALIALSELIGIDLTKKWDVKPDDIFTKVNWTPEDIKLFTEPDDTGLSLAHKIGNWSPTQLSLWGSIFTADFMSGAGVLQWSPTQLNLWAQLFTTDALAWVPKQLNIIGDIFKFIDLDENGNVDMTKLVSFDWGSLFTAIDTSNISDAISRITTLATILGAENAAGLVGAAIKAAGGADELISSLSGTGSNLTTSAASATKGTGDLTHSLTQTYYPFEETAANLTSLSNSIKDNLVTLWGFFDTLAENLGITLNAGTATALINAGAFTKTVLQQGHFEYLPVYQGIRVNQWGNEVLSWYYQDPVTREKVFGDFKGTWPYVYIPAGYKTGGITSGLSLAGEIGPEWVIPTYEPQRSSFLHDVGADPDIIADRIAKKLAPMLKQIADGVNRNSGGNMVFELDGEVLVRYMAKKMRSGDYETLRALRTQI